MLPAELEQETSTRSRHRPRCGPAVRSCGAATSLPPLPVYGSECADMAVGARGAKAQGRPGPRPERRVRPRLVAQRVPLAAGSRASRHVPGPGGCARFAEDAVCGDGGRALGLRHAARRHAARQLDADAVDGGCLALPEPLGHLARSGWRGGHDPRRRDPGMVLLLADRPFVGAARDALGRAWLRLLRPSCGFAALGLQKRPRHIAGLHLQHSPPVQRHGSGANVRVCDVLHRGARVGRSHGAQAARAKVNPCLGPLPPRGSGAHGRAAPAHDCRHGSAVGPARACDHLHCASRVRRGAATRTRRHHPIVRAAVGWAAGQLVYLPRDVLRHLAGVLEVEAQGWSLASVGLGRWRRGVQRRGQRLIGRPDLWQRHCAVRASTRRPSLPLCWHGPGVPGATRNARRVAGRPRRVSRGGLWPGQPCVGDH
mmetsp:Transcript_2908/g.11841  ORF Transcript_2908/g.11841 Transcript_2908/m.11841 type:complete len:427 (-) Transcript_2908:452-1732(-)